MLMSTTTCCASSRQSVVDRVQKTFRASGTGGYVNGSDRSQESLRRRTPEGENHPSVRPHEALRSKGLNASQMGPISYPLIILNGLLFIQTERKNRSFIHTAPLDNCLIYIYTTTSPHLFIY